MIALNRALVIAFILISILGGIFAYLYFNGLSGQHVYETPLEGEIKIACVGDSVTYGHGVSGWISNNYPKQLDTLLGFGFCVNNYGHSGATVQATGDQPYTSYSEYEASLEFDADYKENNPDVRIILATPPKAFYPEGVTSGLTNYDIDPVIVDEIAEIVRDIAAAEGYEIIDINSLTEGRRGLFLSDNVHPNKNGATILAEIFYSYLIEER